ncbi:NAD(P)-dependent glycerol-3-phosphate dehydrogenase [Planctomycetaceae bacterium]|jgi:glycerol-3-phosphate dehydrogenase (NAD(P)+)|nr:NAD(P)-dependent glycerol-3-phosphate dehydrogenase [Planctomycetaceae bacterium]
MIDTKLAILGSGAMATACSIVLTDHPNQSVKMWCHDPNQADDLNKDRENRQFLPGIPLPDRVTATGDIAEAVEGVDMLVAAIPSKFLRSALKGLAPHLTESRPVVSVIKGIENGTFFRPSEIINEILGDRTIISLSGPSHAEEVARRLPASVVAACGDLSLAQTVQERFNTDRFRVYTNSDLVGVELAGALKNVVAIAAGICDGLGYGDNAKSALMTRGLVEMTRFGVMLGAEESTFAGLAGMGDLITTCTSPHSRNRGVGELLGKGQTLDEILAQMHAVAEGVTTVKSLYDLAESRGIDLPICQEVYRVIYENKSAAEATDSLMSRPPGEE